MITDKPILVGKSTNIKFNQYMNIKDYVVYPCGAIETENGWKVSMGINDYCIGLIDVPRSINSHFSQI